MINTTEILDILQSLNIEYLTLKLRFKTMLMSRNRGKEVRFSESQR